MIVCATGDIHSVCWKKTATGFSPLGGSKVRSLNARSKIPAS
jgi:hypothetical protein